MPEKSLLYGLHSVGEPKVQWPELVSRQRPQFGKDLERLPNIYGLRGKARVRHHSHESCLGKCTGRPLPPSKGPEPVDDLSVLCVLRANQGDEDIEIEQERRHSSSAPRSLSGIRNHNLDLVVRAALSSAKIGSWNPGYLIGCLRELARSFFAAQAGLFLLGSLRHLPGSTGAEQLEQIVGEADSSSETLYPRRSSLGSCASCSSRCSSRRATPAPSSPGQRRLAPARPFPHRTHRWPQDPRHPPHPPENVLNAFLAANHAGRAGVAAPGSHPRIESTFPWPHLKPKHPMEKLLCLVLLLKNLFPTDS